VEGLKISVGGLSDLSRSLRKIDAEGPKQLRLAFNEAADLLVQYTAPKIPVVSGKAKRSLKAKSTRTSARVSFGGKNARYVPWLDFGGEGRIAGRPAKREFITEGRYVYPTLRQIRPKIEAALQAGIEQVVRNVGLEMR
jgi:hypothetical protein